MSADIQELMEQLHLSEDEEEEEEDDDMVVDEMRSKPIWDTLKWPSGPYFSDRVLTSNNISLINRNEKGEKYLLSPVAEHLAKLFVSSDQKDDAVYVANFWDDFKAFLPPNDFSSIDDVDWSEVIEGLKEPQKFPEMFERLRAKHGFILVNEDRVPISQYTVRPAAIMGNEQDNFRGKIFPPLTPEMVVLNQSEGESPPKLLAGERFKKIESDSFDNWIAKWENPVTGLTEYIRFEVPEQEPAASDYSDDESLDEFDMHGQRYERQEDLGDDETDEEGERSEVDEEDEADDEGDDDEDIGEINYDDDEDFGAVWGRVKPGSSGSSGARWKRKTPSDEPEDVVNFSVLSNDERYLPLFYLRSLPEQQDILRRAYESSFKVVKDLDKVMDTVLADFISSNITQDDPLNNAFVSYAQGRGITV